jgi:DNA-binding MarR family transcriptional regulator
MKHDPKVSYIAAIEYSRGANELVKEAAPLKLLLLFGIGASADPPTVSQLGLLVGEDLKTTSRGLTALKRQGWVKLIGDRHDERKRRVNLTRPGEVVLGTLYGALAHTAFRIVENTLGRRPGSLTKKIMKMEV